MNGKRNHTTPADNSDGQDGSTEQPTTLSFVDRVSLDLGTITQRGRTEYTGWQIDDLAGEAVVENTSDVVIVNLGMSDDSDIPRAVTDLHISSEKAREMAETLEKAADIVEGRSDV